MFWLMLLAGFALAVVLVAVIFVVLLFWNLLVDMFD